MRLRRSDPSSPGYARRRRGRGFSYLDPSGRMVDDPRELERIRLLAIPPAWRDVWICTDERGHIQATGVDAAGRKQYCYHQKWREQRDAAKFDHVLEFAAALPRLRSRILEDLDQPELSVTRVLATAVRLLDLGAFRIGSEEYAVGDDASFGLATLRRDHVRISRGQIVFSYRAKGGTDRLQTVTDGQVEAVLRRLLRRRGGEQLLACRNGRGWHEVRSTEINEYLRAACGYEATAKDFRTWHATNLAAVGLAVAAAEARSRSARRRAVSRVMREVADFLGNTPAVARSSYVDPRVVDLYHDGVTIPLSDVALPADLGDVLGRTAIEERVLQMLRQEAQRAA